MTGYILWIAEQWRRFAAATGLEPRARNGEALTRWLLAEYPER